MSEQQESFFYEGNLQYLTVNHHRFHQFFDFSDNFQSFFLLHFLLKLVKFLHDYDLKCPFITSTIYYTCIGLHIFASFSLNIYT